MLTERIQAALDREVSGSPRARELLRLLDGRSLDIEARFTPWRVQLRSAGDRLLLERSPIAPGDARIAGSPLGLLSLTREDPQDVIRRGAVTIEGDGQVASRFQELLQLLRPDLEEALSRVLGDMPAHGVARFIRGVTEFGANTARTAALNVGEYFAHERRELVTRSEAREFLDGVDALRERTDRLEARITSLAAVDGNGKGVT